MKGVNGEGFNWDGIVMDGVAGRDSLEDSRHRVAIITDTGIMQGIEER